MASDYRRIAAGAAVLAGTIIAYRLIVVWRKKRKAVEPGQEFDYVIVGAGSAGCVVANRLSAFGSSVLLIEAGGGDNNSSLHIPIIVGTLQRTKIDWQFKTPPQKQTNNRIHFKPRGKILGGSSVLNYMLYVRGNAADYDEWRDMGCAGWGYTDVLPYFLKSEDYEGPTSKYHSKGGPLRVSYPQEARGANFAFIEAFKQAGYPCSSTDYNSESQEGAFLSQNTIKNGKRHSTATAFLHPAAKTRKNLHILTDNYVSQIVFENKRAIGVNVKESRESAAVTIRARKEVILCAGAIGSPHLLLVSGVGPKEEIARLGIKLVADVPGVGKNLQDHLMVPMLFPTKTDEHIITKKKAESIFSILRFLLFSKGLLTTQAVEMLAFLKTLPDIPAPDVQFHFLCATADTRLINENCNLETLAGSEYESGYIVLPTLLYPKSRGTITLNTADIFDHPIVDPHYLESKEDEDTLVRGVIAARKIVQQPALNAITLPEFVCEKWGSDPNSESYIRELVRSRAVNVYHEVGTCKMGPLSDPMSVVDSSSLCVREVSGLRVIDASVMPKVPRGNTNAPTIMIAEKGSDMILATKY